MKSNWIFRTIIGSLFVLFSLSATQAQPVISGRVTDAVTNEPLPFASVYVNASTRGTTADADGQYRLTGVPAGTLELVASAVGFNAVRQPIRLTAGQNRRVDFSLAPNAKALQTITVTAKRSNAYNRLLKQFRRELLGNTAFADKCVITNVEAVVLTVNEGRLEAQSAEPLVIDNRALGYRLHYNLTYFDSFRQATHYAGTSRFEPLTPDNAEQAARWERNRQKAYQGSIRHLLASLIAGTHEREGFLVYQALFNVPADPSIPIAQMVSERPTVFIQPDSVFKQGELPQERQLLSPKPVEVFYTRKRVISTPYRDLPYAYSLVYMPTGKAALVTTDGWIAQPNGLEVRGAMSDDRLASLLPADWKPADEEISPVAATTAGRPGQPDAGLDSLAARHRRLHQRTAPRLYVQTDKALYCTGDQLYLSAHVPDAARLNAARPSSIATPTDVTLQVELISPTGQSVLHQWLRLTDGRAASSFRLADTLTAGTYRLRAYTAMDQLANGPAFECSFPVYNVRGSANGSPVGLFVSTATGPAAVPPPLPDPLNVQFLPEGGRWLAGVAGRVGIKALQPDGRGRAIGGRIVDQTGLELARFRTNTLGMGQVTLTPQAGQRYVALVESSPNGPPRSVALPTVEPEGWSLAADAVSDSNRLTVNVRATGRYAQQPVYVTLQSGDQLTYRQKWVLTGGEARFSLPTATLPPGVSRLTLWDMTNQPRAERLVFVPERTGIVQMRVITAKPRYDAREQVVIGLQFRDADGYAVTGNWSAAVTDADQLPADTTQPDLRTHLLLTGGLRGTIESPAYYLEPEHRGDLDNLLLTQGWRRLPTPQPADSTGGWTLSGHVRDEQGRAVADKAVVVQLQQNGQKMLRSLITDAQGVFRLAGLLIADTVQVRARVPDPGPAGAILTFDAPGVAFTTSAPPAPNWPTLTNWLNDARTRQLAWPALYRDSTARQLAEVVVRANKPRLERPVDVQRSSLHNGADGVWEIDEKKASAFENVGQMLNTLTRVQLQRGFSTSGDNRPLILLDGVEVEPGTVLEGLAPVQIKRIEVLKNPATAGIYGVRSAAGVIAIYTRKGGVEELPVRTSVATTVTGFVPPREFYVPRYDLSPTTAVNDRRDVLFWEPLGQTDTDGRARLLFPLSDTAKRLRLVIQGLTSEGVPLSFTWLLPVR